MSLKVDPSGASCGATITGVQLNQSLSDDLIAEIQRTGWSTKSSRFPISSSHPRSLVGFSEQFGEIGEDPFFGHIDEHPQVAAIQRNADEKTTIFAEFFSQRLELYAGPACRDGALRHYHSAGWRGYALC